MKKLIVVLLIVLIIFQFYLTRTPALTNKISLQDVSLYQGDLVLINKQSEIQEDPRNLAAIPNQTTNTTIEPNSLLQKHVGTALRQMMRRAGKVGVKHFQINSAYRSGKLQQRLYEAYGADFALPAGHSEHQTGLSVDIGSTRGKMNQSKEGRWLAKNAHKFGFIIRYPKGKETVTGISFEPWHIRYVGLPHSTKMYEEDWALEEYIHYLEQDNSYQIHIADRTYFVQYTKQRSIRIPDTTQFQVSGTNKHGFIVTSRLKHD
ncbi:M15 family metallopeptidase [Exiguobacterium artemiae]|uniref:M15 family metallopeptidase n=1 Tax=Exiguobacterium artemiae TaxID=340145 RepID=UPI003D066BEC